MHRHWLVSFEQMGRDGCAKAHQRKCMIWKCAYTIYIYIYICLEQLAQTEANIFACRTHSHIKLHYASHDTFDKRIQTSAVQISQSPARLAKNEIIFNFPFVLVFQAACSQSCRQLLFDIMHYCMHYGIRQKKYMKERAPRHIHIHIYSYESFNLCQQNMQIHG